MILIADSGSTKTDWRLIDNKKQIHQFATQGINPYFQTTSQISEILKFELIPQLNKNDLSLGLSIYFYGAGCKVDDKKQIVFEALQEYFPESPIEINSE